MYKSQVTFYDGINAKPHMAWISPINRNAIQVQYGPNLEHVRHYEYEQMELIGAVGNLKSAIELHDDARIEFDGDLPTWLNLNTKKLSKAVWKLERSPTLIVFSVVFVICFVVGLMKWGIPAAATLVSKQLPAESMTFFGNEAEKQVMNMTSDSKISKEKQQKILKDYQQYVAQGQPAKIKFRAGEQIGANALAIPNNTIILTDELIELAKDDREIVGVLAHEQAHLLKKHSMQQALSSIGTSIIWVAITGDTSDLVSTLPLLLVTSHYSRDFESEADEYALALMYEQKISTLHFANFIERLGDGESTEKSIFDYLSSHPSTVDRIERARNYGK